MKDCCDLCGFPLSVFVINPRLIVKVGRITRGLKICEVCNQSIINVKEVRKRECAHRWQIVAGGQLDHIKEVCLFCNLTQERMTNA
mgnify:CR=1